MRLLARAATGWFLLVSTTALGAAWPTAKDEVIITETTLVDFYDYYARNSGSSALLQAENGSVVQAGHVQRYGFLLGVEYGVTDRLSITLTGAFFYTRHLEVGENVRIFTNSVPNQSAGFQDFTGNVKYTLFQTNGALQFAIAPYVGWVVPFWNYDTSLNNPIGDGVVSIDPGLGVSLMVPKARAFANADILYKVRENKSARVGAIFPAEIKRTVPGYPDNLIGGQIQDQIQFTAEAGYFITDWLSARLVVRRIETLGGEKLSFNGMAEMMARGLPRTSMFDNSLAYDQDALYFGGGAYVQLGQYFGVGVTYVQALWFRNFPNMKTLVLSLSFNPGFAAAKRAEELKLIEALQGEPAPEEAAPESPAQPGTEEAPPTDAPPSLSPSPKP